MLLLSLEHLPQLIEKMLYKSTSIKSSVYPIHITSVIIDPVANPLDLVIKSTNY